MSHQEKHLYLKKSRLVVFLLFAFTLLNSSCVNHKNRKLSFNSFLHQFMTDTTFQKQHIEYPLMIYYSDEDFPLDILEKSINDSNAYTFIDMANDLPPGLNDTNLYHIHISQNTDTIYYQKITKSNNINITYTFLRAGKSYKLFAIEDNTD